MAVTHGIGTQVNMLILLNVFRIKNACFLYIQRLILFQHIYLNNAKYYIYINITCTSELDNFYNAEYWECMRLDVIFIAPGKTL